MGLMPLFISTDFTLSFLTSVGATAATITVPSTVVLGDLLVLFDVIEEPTATAVPTDFNSLITNSLGDIRIVQSWKIADGDDANSVVTGINVAGARKILLVFRGTHSIVGVVEGSPVFGQNDGNPAALNITASAGAAPLIVLAGFGGIGWVAGSELGSPALDNVIDHGNIGFGYKIYNTAPLDHSIDMDNLTGNNHLSGGYLECSR